MDRMSKLYAGVLVVMALVASTTHASESGWELKKDKKSVEVYVRKTEDSAHYEFRGVSTMKTNINSLVNLMRDMSVMDKWLETCREPQVIEEPDGASRVIHMKNDSPFPIVISDRDLLLLQRFRRLDERSVIVDLVDRSTQIPHERGYVRGEFNGHWKFTEVGEGLVEVEYQGLTDPEGSVPARLANLVVVDVPYKTLQKIRKILHNQSSKYDMPVSISSL